MNSFGKIARRNRFMAWFPWWWDFKEEIKLLREGRKWRRRGWFVPLPGLLKRAIIKTEARQFGAKVLVETGTYLGDTLWFFRNEFAQMYSIEVQPDLARLARERFANRPGIKIVEGDSAECLQRIVPEITEPCVYWLDGHYSAGLTGRGSSDCPIWGEFKAIVSAGKAPALILIDDARCFGVDKDYPSLAELRQFMTQHLPHCQLTVANDIIRIGPPPAGSTQ
jgi:hypothetical protein